MSRTMEDYWHWLTGSLTGEPGLLWQLVRKYETPKGVFEAKEEALLEGFPRSPAGIARVLRGRKEWDFEREREQLVRKGIGFVSCEHPDYPGRLKEVSEKPGGLFVRGELPLDTRPSIAIVGARACSAYGRNAALWFARELSGAGMQVISGMALGIDGFSHQGALLGGGKTFGVLGGGVDICYPESHRELYMRLEQEGGLLSESPPGTRPLRHLFPLRNRIISGLSDAVLIIEAKEKSGSLITADLALEQGRDVYVVPGRLLDPLSAGCNSLICQGAGIALSPEQILEEMGIISNISSHKSKYKKIDLEKAEDIVYSCLGLQSQNLEELCEKTGITATEALRILTSLELKGYAKEIYKNNYIRAL
ncbi:MAG: DNA-protecting protein DprA [Lachnospiraceae bacterium]|jgi:DNA processing protein|nr:DNA-protecting protein DprA [Lachnospiraceae bacterium]